MYFLRIGKAALLLAYYGKLDQGVRRLRALASIGLFGNVLGAKNDRLGFAQTSLALECDGKLEESVGDDRVPPLMLLVDRDR